MKLLLDKTAAVTWLWVAIAFGSCLMATANTRVGDEEHRETHERITFMNFSEKPIQVYWRDPISKENVDEALVYPYNPYTAKTYNGHKFVYEWKGQHEMAATVHKTSTRGVKEEEGNVDTTDIPAQVHILGGMDQPETRKVVCGSSKGDIHINIKPFWSPWGAIRFLQLASKEVKYLHNCGLNRVVPKFLTQFGIGANYELRSKYRSWDIPDDPQLDPKIPFRPGSMSYAGSGPNSRSTEVFIVMPDTAKSQLEYFGQENPWETSFGYVDQEDLNVVGSWHSYGDMEPWGKGPDPQKMYKSDGYEYLEKNYPDLDYLSGCAIVPQALSDTKMTYDELAKIVFTDIEEEL